MTDDPPAAVGTEPPDTPAVPHPTDPRSTADLCPFLSSADGDWRSIVAVREHRCTAVTPVAALSLEKQRRLCLAREHITCTTYLAARQQLLDEGPVGESRPDGNDPGDPAIERSVLRWAVPVTAPVVLDRGRPSVRDVLVRRSTTQLALVLLMALAFLVLVLARLSAGGAVARPGSSTGASGVPGPTATLPAVASASGASSSPSPAASAPPPSPSPEPTPSARSSSAATASPGASPSAARTYRVVAGDTLSGIAARFGVTLRALETANGITDPSRLRVGTVLRIP